MSEAVVHLERRNDGVAIVRLDNPQVNAMSGALLTELQKVAEALLVDPPGAVVVTGGDRVFAAGADISEFRVGDGVLASEAAGVLSGRFQQALGAVEAIPRATIAAIAGVALGGGCELALACDFRIASDRARLGQPEILLGLIPGGGGTQRLTRLVGPAVAKDLVFSGRQVPAQEALRLGLVDEVVPAADVLERALERAAGLAAGAVVAQGLAKQAVDGGIDLPLADALALERRRFAEAFATDDATIGVGSFLEHGPGKARFTGR